MVCKTVRDLLGTRNRYGYSHQRGNSEVIYKYLDSELVAYTLQKTGDGLCHHYIMIFKGARTYFAFCNGERYSLKWAMKRIEGATFDKKETGKKFQKWMMLKGEA